MGICLKWHGDAGFLVNLTLWCLLTIIIKSFVDVFNSLGPSDAFICVSKLNIIGSDDGLSPTRRQAIIWTNAGILLIRPLRTNFSEIFIEVYTFSFKKMHSKMSSGKWRPFCLGLNVIRQYIQIIHSIHIGDELALLDYQIISRSKLHVNKCWAMCQLTKTEWSIHVSVNYATIGSDNGLSTVQWQAIIQTNVGLFVNSVTAVKLVQSNWLPLDPLTKAQ